MTKVGKVYSKVVVPLLSEFVAQFILTFWGVMTVGPSSSVGNENSSDSSPGCSNYAQNIFVPAFQAGLAVWMLIVCFWKISVVHFNPSISMGFLVSGHLKPIMFVPYVLVQCLASVVASYVAKGLFGHNPAVIAIPDDVSSLVVFFNDFIITGIVIFFAVAVVMDKSYDQATGPIAIGLTVFQGLLSAQWIGVACISPSRAFGPAVVTGGAAWNRHWLLWFADLGGAAFASGLYMLFFAPPEICWFTFLKKIYEKRWKRDKNEQENEVFDQDKPIIGTNL